MIDENLFEAVGQKGRLADHVADQIEKLIVDGRLEPGTRLPSEAELAKQFEVSRTVIREAVQMLVTKGLVETRHGVGTTVKPFSRDIIVSSLSRFLNVQDEGVSFDHLHQVRCILELAIAQLAARNATEADVSSLRQILGDMESLKDAPEAFATKDADFHRALAKATHNPLLVVLLDSIRDLLQDYILSTLPHLDISQDVHPFHYRILECVVDHDVEGARQAMWEHITQAPWEQDLDEDMIKWG